MSAIQPGAPTPRNIAPGATALGMRSRRLNLPSSQPVPVLAPALLTRPTGVQVQFERTPLARVHRVFLAVITAYLLGVHPQAWGPLLLMGVAGILADMAPATWRRWFFTEICSLAVGCLAFYWTWNLAEPPAVGALHTYQGPMLGWMRMLIAVWVLVPCRPGFLRMIAVLAGLELVLAGGPGGNGRFWTPFVLVPLAVASLIYDAHLRIGAAQPVAVHVGRQRLRLAPRWLLLPLALVAGLALLAALGFGALQGMVKQGGAQPPGGLGSRNAGRHLPQEVRPDQAQWTDVDDAVVARLMVEPARVGRGPHYLRAFTAPHLALQDGYLVWRPVNPPRHPLRERYQLHDGHLPRMAELRKNPGMGDYILRPDGSCRVELFGMFADVDGNIQRPEFAELPRAYPVDLGETSFVAEEWTPDLRSESLFLEPELEDILREKVPELAAWRNLPHDAKAMVVVKWLSERCAYDRENLPRVGPAPGAQMTTFLFDADLRRRRGHCQYFSSAACVLLRALGVPARVVVGFSADEMHPRGVVFRNRGAHAWIEYAHHGADGRLRWWRCDPTPSSHLTARGGSGAADDPFLEEDPSAWLADAAQDAAQAAQPPTRRWPWFVLAAGLLVALAALIAWARRRHAGDPRELVLRQQTEDLVSLALDLGIPVQAATTLSALAAAVGSAARQDLTPLLSEHLAARFGQGPLPRPWPVAELRMAARRRDPPVPRGPV